MNTISRRTFIKYGAAAGATAVIAVGGWRLASALMPNTPVMKQKIYVKITDAIKEMVTHNEVNDARCYFWIYKMSVDGAEIQAECPGPTITALNGDQIEFTITNALDEPHSLFIAGQFDSGIIEPGKTVTKSFTANKSGACLYYDNLNSPVNRVMGLHGALIVLPRESAAGHKFTPYDYPTPNVQAIFDAFGSEVFPGLAWEKGDAATYTPPFRHYAWITHQASSRLFEEVGRLPAGQIYPADEFIKKHTAGEFKANNSGISLDKSTTPEYFSIDGQSGFFAHFDPVVTPTNRIGEPAVVHVMNAGLWTHSMHIHANHCYVTIIDGVVQENPLWLDTMTLLPMSSFDYILPYMRPPDVPNDRGIGRPDQPFVGVTSGKPLWPPVEEFEVFMPEENVTAKDSKGNPVMMGQRMSPLCYPMHDHSEPTQTSQGGNYNCGLISGMYFVGDRNSMLDFPIDEDFNTMYRGIRGVGKTEPAAGTPPTGYRV